MNRFVSLACPHAQRQGELLAQRLFVLFGITLFVIGGRNQIALAEEPELFRGTPTFAVGNGPTAIASCDVNEDGLPDVVTANQTFNDIAVLLSDGLGGFRPQIRFGVGPSPTDLVCIDLNGDGHLDVVTTNNANGTLSILRGNGDGTFMVGALSVIVQSGPLSLVAGTMDDDAIPDIAVGSASAMRVYHGRGDFTFTFDVATDTFSGRADDIALSKVDADELNDLIIVSSSNQVRLLWGTSTGVFIETVAALMSPTSPVSVDVADFDEDGVPDILVANSNSNDVSIFFGLGVRQFAAAQTEPVGAKPMAVRVGDVNGDGHIDVATSNESSNDVSIMLGLGDGGFLPEIRFGAGDNSLALTIADFDDDGQLDVATANFASNDVSLLRGNGDGTFRGEPRFVVGDSPRAVVACDLNEDGIADLASANFSSNTVSVLLGLGRGSYAAAFHYPVAEGPIAIACAEMKEDGALDLIIAHETSSEVSVLLGFGDGTFLTKPRFSVGPAPDDLAVCDLNEDGHLDVVTVNGSDTSILFGDGNGFFQQEVRKGFPYQTHIECVKLDADEHFDLVSVWSFWYIAVRLGNGDGSFQDQVRTRLSFSTSDFVAANINADALIDLAGPARIDGMPR